VGETGVAVAGAVPVAWSGIEAATPWLNPKFASLSIAGKLKHTVARFTNTLSQGFGLGPVFTAGSEGIDFAAETTIPNGGWIKTTTVCLTCVITDFITGAVV